MERAGAVELKKRLQKCRDRGKASRLRRDTEGSRASSEASLGQVGPGVYGPPGRVGH